jgi:hypothetical protein
MSIWRRAYLGPPRSTPQRATTATITTRFGPMIGMRRVCDGGQLVAGCLPEKCWHVRALEQIAPRAMRYVTQSGQASS